MAEEWMVLGSQSFHQQYLQVISQTQVISVRVHLVDGKLLVAMRGNMYKG